MPPPTDSSPGCSRRHELLRFKVIHRLLNGKAHRGQVLLLEVDLGGVPGQKGANSRYRNEKDDEGKPEY